MKTSDLIELLYSFESEEVYIEIDDVEYDFSIIEKDEVFDGFDEVFPEHLCLIPKK